MFTLISFTCNECLVSKNNIFNTSLPLFLGGETSVRYQEGFSRKVQFISSLESGQSMFKSHLFPRLQISMKVWKWKRGWKLWKVFHPWGKSTVHLVTSYLSQGRNESMELTIELFREYQKWQWAWKHSLNVVVVNEDEKLTLYRFRHCSWSSVHRTGWDSAGSSPSHGCTHPKMIQFNALILKCYNLIHSSYYTVVSRIRIRRVRIIKNLGQCVFYPFCTPPWFTWSVLQR